jgi:hypothetical protein
MNKYIRAFIAGSSFPVLFAVFLFYLVGGLILNPGNVFDYRMMVALPIIYGLFNVGYFLVFDKLKIKSNDKKLLYAGALLGLCLVLFSNFVYGGPMKLFGISGKIQYVTIPLAVVAYALVWRYILKYMNSLMKVK